MIKLEKYDPTWKSKFNQIKDKFITVSNGLIAGIEHVGSTAVPNLAAKPTIDICIGVNNLVDEGQKLVEAIKTLGYEYIPAHEEGIPERRYLQLLDHEGNHLVHVHIVGINQRLWNEYIHFRNYLIEFPDQAKVYEDLKISLKERFSNDRLAYTNGKDSFIKSSIAQASTRYLATPAANASVNTGQGQSNSNNNLNNTSYESTFYASNK